MSGGVSAEDLAPPDADFSKRGRARSRRDRIDLSLVCAPLGQAH